MLLGSISQYVRCGEPLLTFDKKKILAAGHPLTTAYVVPNSEDFGTVSVLATGKLDKLSAVLKIERQHLRPQIKSALFGVLFFMKQVLRRSRLRQENRAIAWGICLPERLPIKNGWHRSGSLDHAKQDGGTALIEQK